MSTKFTKGKRDRRLQGGFTLLELAIATLVLMVGIASVVQLVPSSLRTNLNNRLNTTAMVFAQRELDQMAEQPLTSTTFTDSDGRTIYLGSVTSSNTLVGSPTVMQGTQVVIDFTAATVANYNYTFTDTNDPEGAQYQMRWAVISIVSNGVVISKRFIVGCQGYGISKSLQTASVDTMVQK